MIYTLEQIKELVEPIAQKYKLKTLWVFGSYARGEATEDSDVDFLMDYTDSTIGNIFDFSDIVTDLEQTFKRDIDLISTLTLFSPIMKKNRANFIDVVSKERVILYEN
jgi:predicted nucleotidyltransferase